VRGKWKRIFRSYKQMSYNTMASKFHNTIVDLSVRLCTYLREDTGINEVALSGGVFQNPFILKKISNKLRTKEFIVYNHTNLPSNDGAIAIGQIIIANTLIENNSYMK